MCLFCRMLAGEVPMDVVRETGLSVAFRDINPQAPTHVLIHGGTWRTWAHSRSTRGAGRRRRTRGVRGRGGGLESEYGWWATPVSWPDRPSSTPTCTCSGGAGWPGPPAERGRISVRPVPGRT